VVVSKAENSKGGYVQWNCVCDCGNKKTVPGNDLRRGGTKSCGCLLKLGYSEATFNKVFKQIKRQAKVRGYFWDLTRKDIKDITKQDCCYCGVSPKQRCKSNHNNGDYVYNGIDRVDNSKGYTIDNIVPCCFQCNAAKRAYTSEDFFAWVERVYNHSIGDKK